MEQDGSGSASLPLIASVAEAVLQAERIRKEREAGRFRRQLRKSNSSVQEWVRVPTPDGFVYVSAKMGGHVWDRLDTYYRSAKAANAGYAVRAFVALGARPALPGEADLSAIEDQIGQRPRKDATILVLADDSMAPRQDAARPAAAPARAPNPGRGAGLAPRTAKLFRSGRAQLVHLPEGFRLPGEEVRVRRHGDAVVLEPIAPDWAWLDELGGGLDEDVRHAAEEEPADAPERPAVDRFFR